MPLYEYKCDNCGNTFEVIQKFSDAPVEKCRTCGASVHKLLSAPAIQFKGTGWYVTDYGHKGGANSATTATELPDNSARHHHESPGTAAPASAPAAPASDATAGSGKQG